MRRTSAAVVFALLLSGCSGGGGTADADDVAAGFEGFGVTAGAGKGILLGVVVDDTIRPLPGAQVTLQLPGGASANQTTDGEGRFAFGELEPGTYLVEASLLNYKAAQSSVEVQPDVPEPKVARLLLERLYSQEPYVTPLKFEGFIQCGYSVSGVMSSLCLNDYTHFVGPYTCEQCEHILDRRGTDFEIEAGWQTAVFEMTWEPTTQGTSDDMRLTISHFPRSASHWYCGGASTSPLLVRMELNVTCEDQQSEPEQVPPEGLPNMHMFAATSANGSPVSLVVSQQFVVYTHVFHFGKPPEGWSFVAGDPPPF